MNADFRVSVGFPEHIKTRRLLHKLKHDGCLSLVFLWAYAAAHRPTGVLSGMDEEAIALAGRWSGEPQEFVDELLRIGFVDQLADANYILHDWADHNPWVFAHPDRKKKAQDAARSRWEKRPAPVAPPIKVEEGHDDERAGKSTQRSVPGAVEGSAHPVIETKVSEEAQRVVLSYESQVRPSETKRDRQAALDAAELLLAKATAREVLNTIDTYSCGVKDLVFDDRKSPGAYFTKLAENW